MEKFHERRMESVRALAQDDNFQALIEYWEIEYEIIDNKIDTLKGKELEMAVLERAVIRKHLFWMQNMLEQH